MTNKIFQLLATIKVKEISEFIQFVSVFGNEAVLKLLNFYLKFHPEFEDDLLSFTTVEKEVFPQGKLNQNRLHQLHTHLLKLSYRYISIKEIEHESFAQKYWLIQALGKRNVYSQIPRQIARVNELAESTQQEGAELYLNHYQTNYFQIAYTVEMGGRVGDIGLDQLTEPLDHFYLIHKLQYFISVLHRKRVYGEENKLPMMNEILIHLKDNIKGYSPLVQAYYEGIQLFMAESPEDYFNQLRERLRKNHDSFLAEDLISLYFTCLNYCNLTYQGGSSQHQTYMFELYKEMADLDLLFIQPGLAKHNYRNVVSLGIRLKVFEWTENFIEAHKDSIPLEERRGVYSFNMARLTFARKDYRKTKRLLLEVVYEDFLYKISSNILLLKAYYVLEEGEAFLALCHTTDRYIRNRKNLSETRKKTYLNFFRLAKYMFKLKRRNKSYLVQGLPRCIKRLHLTKQLTEKEWITEELINLIKKVPFVEKRKQYFSDLDRI